MAKNYLMASDLVSKIRLCFDVTGSWKQEGETGRVRQLVMAGGPASTGDGSLARGTGGTCSTSPLRPC